MEEEVESPSSTGKVLTVPYSKRRTAPLTWNGMEVKLDAQLPDNAVELRDGNGKVLFRATIQSAEGGQ